MPKVTKQAPPKKKVVRKVKGDISSRFEDLDEGFQEQGIKINIYGASGSGKTTFWATFPGPILSLLCSGGKTPGELRSINTPEYRKKVKKLNIQTIDDYLEAVQYCKSNPDKFATVILDHATGLQDLALKEVLGLEAVPAQKSWGLCTQQEWGQVAIQMKEMLREILNLDQNVAIIAQERAFNTGDDEADGVMPFVASALMPSVVGWLNPAVDYICQTFKRKKMVEKETKIKNRVTKRLVPGKGVEYCLRTAPDDLYATKFRAPKGTPVPDEIIDPTYDKLMKYINAQAK